MTPNPKTTAQRQAIFKARQRARGCSQMTVWVTTQQRDHIRRWLCNESVLSEIRHNGNPGRAVIRMEAHLLALARQSGLENAECALALASFFGDLALDPALARPVRDAAAAAETMSLHLYEKVQESMDHESISDGEDDEESSADNRD